MAHQHQPTEQELQQRNRLPTLLEVLGRRTLAPVDLFSFYIYMRDQQRSVDYLDFWLDVTQHMSLCRHFVRELRRSMLMDTPEMDKATSKRSSQILDSFPGLGESPSQNDSDEKSGYMQRPSNDTGSMLNGQARAADHSPSHSLNSHNSKQHARNSSDQPSHDRPRPSFMSTTDVRTDSNSPGHTVGRADLKASAEKILYTYVLPGAEREIVLPETMLRRITQAVEEDGRDDPEVFAEAKDYVFQAMERDAFPGFLQARALGNLVPLSVLIRLIIGLSSLMAGFWGGFFMILTNKPRHIRCWLILPYTVGSYFLISYQYKLDIVAAYIGFSEYTWMNWSRIREPFVRKLLITRASVAFLVFALVAVALSVLFIFVPGTNF